MSTTVDTTGHCGWCGCWHNGRCPDVEEIEYYENGSVKRVRFRDARQIVGQGIGVQPDQVVWPMIDWGSTSSVTPQVNLTGIYS